MVGSRQSSDRGAPGAVLELNGMLEHFVQTTPGVSQVVGVSSDGLLMALASPMPRGEGDKLAATVSGMTTLAITASQLLDQGPLTQVITEFRDGYILASMLSGRACLGVVASKDCDLGVVGYETTMLVQRFGRDLSPDLIRQMKNHLPL